MGLVERTQAMEPLRAVLGLRYVPEYLKWDTHDRLLAEVQAQPWHAIGDQRRIQFYGYWYDHAEGGMYRIGALPSWARELARCVVKDDLMPYVADQLIVSEYMPGQGIRPHVDAPVFADVIVVVSLGSQCIMEFTGAGTRKEEVLLEPRSALVTCAVHRALRSPKKLIPPAPRRSRG
jgi:alkylated DNA repair dioxygenase AlkB